MKQFTVFVISNCLSQLLLLLLLRWKLVVLSIFLLGDCSSNLCGHRFDSANIYYPLFVNWSVHL